MAKQILNTGTSNNDKSGDTLRAGGLKIKANFNEIYAALANDGSNISGGDLLKTGSYTDLRNLPDFHPISTSGSFNDLEDKPQLATFVAAPLSLTGVDGNMTGQIAADANYVYVCTADWTPAPVYSSLTFVHEDNVVDYVLAAATSDVASSVVLKPGTIAPEVDFTITDGSTTRTITLVTEIGDGQGGVWYECTLDGQFTSVANTQYKIAFTPAVGDFAAHFTWNGAFQPLVDAHTQGTLAAKLFKSGDNTGRVITHAVRDSVSNELTITYTGPQFTNFTGMSIVEDQPAIWKRIPLNVAADRLVNGNFEITINADGGLTFPDGTIQTTAYTAGETGITKYVAVNNDGVISGSDDGIIWNEYTSNLSGINRVAVGPNKIVYIANSSSGHGNDESLWYADTYDTEPTEVTSLSTRGFWEVKYFNSISKFVAVGNDGDGLATLHYSDDGITWTASSIDPTYLLTFGSIGSNSFCDIAENELGFFVISANKTLGGFFLSNITDVMDGNNHVDLSTLPTDPDEVVWANSFYFQGWHLFTDNNEWCYNSQSNPTAGTFQTDFITLNSVWEDQIGIPGGDVVEFVVGEYAGMSVIMASTTAGQIVYWPTVPAGPYISVPKPYTATITAWTSSTTSAITTTGVYGSTGEKFIVTGSSVTGYNGTYYLGDNGEVFTDNALTVPFDTTGLDPFTGVADIAWSHGQFIDALHYNDGVFYAGNDNEELFKSTNAGQTWVKVDQLGGGLGEGDGYLNDIDSYITPAGDITFSGVSIRGKATEGKTGLIKLVPNTTFEGHSFLDNGQFVQIYPTNLYDAPHIHIAAGVGAASEGDIFLGDDNKYVQVNHNGNVSIQTSGGNNWSFDNTGVLTLPINGDIKDSTGTSVLGGGGASTGDYTFTNAAIAVTDNASLTVTGDSIFTATIPSSMGMYWSESNSFLGTYTSGSIGYSDFSQFDGQKVIFFDNVMSQSLSTELSAMAIGDTILVDELSNPYTVTLTSTFSSSMGRFIASVTTPESDRTVTNQVVITRTVSQTNEFQFKGNGELVAPKVVAATTLLIPSYTRAQCGHGNNTIAGSNGAIISVSDSDTDPNNPSSSSGYFTPNMLAYWIGNVNQNPSPGQAAGAWVYVHQNGTSSYYLVSQP